MQFLHDNWGTLMTACFAVSEALSLIPGLKSNGIFQAIYNFLKSSTSDQPKV